MDLTAEQVRYMGIWVIKQARLVGYVYESLRLLTAILLKFLLKWIALHILQIIGWLRLVVCLVRECR